MYQQKYIAYAKAHGKTPGEMLEHDKRSCPGGCMAEYIIWISKKIKAFRDISPGSFVGHALRDHGAFTAYLLVMA